MNDDHLRLSDAERDLAAADLAEHYASGRLSAEEHSERLDRVWAARTRGEIPAIFRDLPSRFAPPPPRGWTLPQPNAARPPRPAYGPTRGRPPVPARRGLPLPLLIGLGLLVALTVFTHLPLILIGVVIYLVLRGNRGRSHHRHSGWSSR